MSRVGLLMAMAGGGVREVGYFLLQAPSVTSLHGQAIKVILGDVQQRLPAIKSSVHKARIVVTHAQR